VPTIPRLFDRSSDREALRLADVLRQETVGGALLVVAALIGLVWINSPWADSYESVRTAEFGPAALHLHLSLEAWAADGLLAIFFFVAGLEVKREFVAGDLRDPRRAVLPVVAACGGMAMPALIYVAINAAASDGDTAGWAIPTATDIAFALAILAVVSRHLPDALRTFLLSLAVVDDLIAITIIAIFFTSELDLVWLAAALVPLAAFGVLVQRRVRHWWLLVPLALLTWGLVHASGVHATVAGVLLALTVPVLRSEAAGGPEAGPGLAEHFEHRLRPLSAAVAVPIFALLAAGVELHGVDGVVDAMQDPVAIGIVAGLVVGKTVGVLGSSALVARFTHAQLDERIGWWDVLGISILAGVGFTVSLLIGELAFPEGGAREEHVKIGILAGTVVAIVLGSAVLRLRGRRHRDGVA
jgi:Na+:H+ antiporter, NhaA family